jgi:hypothetical protein
VILVGPEQGGQPVGGGAGSPRVPAQPGDLDEAAPTGHVPEQSER